MEAEDPGSLMSPVAGDEKTVPRKAEQEKTKDRRQEAGLRKLDGRRQYDEVVVKAFRGGYIKDPYKQKMQEWIINM